MSNWRSCNEYKLRYKLPSIKRGEIKIAPTISLSLWVVLLLVVIFIILVIESLIIIIAEHLLKMVFSCIKSTLVHKTCLWLKSRVSARHNSNHVDIWYESWIFYLTKVNSRNMIRIMIKFYLNNEQDCKFGILFMETWFTWWVSLIRIMS